MTFLAIDGAPGDQLACARIWVADRCPASPRPVWRGERYRHDRISVAYVSTDFRDHAVGRQIADLIERHDMVRFETIGISLGPDSMDPMRGRLARAFERFIDASAMRDAEVAEWIRDAEVDIVVDLNGFTKGARMGILSRRPAAVQVSFLGYPGTTGSDFVDYIIADRFVIPAELREHYTERTVWLPDTFHAADGAAKIAESPSREDVGLPSRGFVFCSFNNSYKLGPAHFDSWMRLLQRVDGAVLWLLADHPGVEANLRREAAARSVDPARLVFGGRLPHAEYLARYRLADLFLDTLPFNAGATASNALYAGLPVLTCVGESFAARMAGSQLHAIGLPELITASMDDYEALAWRLATDQKRLSVIRETLVRNRLTHPLFDADRFRRHLEAAYTTMWERSQRGQPPEAFAVAPLE